MTLRSVPKVCIPFPAEFRAQNIGPKIVQKNQEISFRSIFHATKEPRII